MMFKLIFTNSKGESVELYGSPFRLIRVEGLGDVEANNQTQKSPFQDGTTLIDTTLEERFPEIELKIVGKNSEDLAVNRRKIASVFNPKLGEGVLQRISDDGIHRLEVVAESVPYFPDGRGNRGNTYQKCLINLRAPNPYWQTVHVSSKQMSFIMGGLSFPLQLGTVFSQRSFRRIFNNEGDVPTPVKIEFKGPAINPIIRNNTTGEFVQVNRTLAETDTLVINTAFGEKSVTIVDEEGNSENAFNWIDLESTFFQLEVGENELEYNSNNDSTKTRVVISYRHRYVGV